MKAANFRGYLYNRVVGILTLDVTNAFNMTPWDTILSEVRTMFVPDYLINLLGSYLYNRKIICNTKCAKQIIRMNCGVLKESVLGPDLWNLLYDDLLHTLMPTIVELIAFADDVVIVATVDVATATYLLEKQLAQAIGLVMDWINEHGLTLAMKKTETVVLNQNRWHYSITITCGNNAIHSQSSLKYLGL